MADFGKYCKSLQTLWNASLSLLKVFLTLCATVCVDFWGIRKGRKLAVLEVKACGIRHGFEHCGTLWNASKTIVKWFVPACATVFVDLGWIRKGRKLADFEQKAWARAHGFEHGRFWQVLQISSISLKRLLNPSKTIPKSLRDWLCLFWGIRKGRELAVF